MHARRCMHAYATDGARMRFLGLPISPKTRASVLRGAQLLTVLGMFACGRTARPAAAPAATASAVPAVAAPTAPSTPLASPPTATEAVDVLLLAVAPHLDALGCDAALSQVIPTLGSLSGAIHVHSMARDGEARIVVRFGAVASQDAAMQAVTGAWTAAKGAFGDTTIAASTPGARAQLAEVFLADAGRAAATTAAHAAQASLSAALSHETRLHMAGTVRPCVTVLPLAPSLHREGLSTRRLVDALRGAPANLTTLLALQSWLHDQTIVAGGQPRPLETFVTTAAAQGEPLRDARDGRVVVTALLADGVGQRDEAAWIQQEGVWHSALQTPPGVSVHTLRLSSAARFEWWGSETPRALAERFQRARLTPDCIGMLAMSGRDGVPEALDREGQTGQLWTVWLIAAPADIEAVAQAATPILAEGGHPVQRLTATDDPSLAWLRSGPGPAKRTRIDPAAARQRGALGADLALAADLLARPLPLATAGPLPLWLSLPAGALDSDRLQLPIATSQGPLLPLGELLALPGPGPAQQIERNDGTRVTAPQESP